MKDFEAWLDRRIKEGTNCEWYDPDGNSPRAVVTRWKQSKIKSFYWEFLCVLSDIRYLLVSFNGLETPIGWFVELLILPFIFPIIPFVRAITRLRSAKNDYLNEYKIHQKDN